MKKTYLIVGGVAGGAGVATRLRRLDEEAEIIIYEKGDYLSYANCGLPYYVGNVIKERGNLFVTADSTFEEAFNVRVFKKHEVLAIDRKNKRIKVKNLASGETFDKSYTKLVLSPGAAPFIPQIKGVDSKIVHTVRTVNDVDRITEKIPSLKKAVVVGGGFIGIEMAENLRHRGADVYLVEALDQVFAPLDKDMVWMVHRELLDNGVKLRLSKPLEEIGENFVQVKDERISDVDLVILSIGVKAESGIAREAGLETGKRGHIVVDRTFRTSDHDIYALGDAVEYPSPITGKPQAIALAGPANKMARIVAENIVFEKGKQYSGTYGASIAKVFSLSAGSVGMNEKQLKEEGMEYYVAITHSRSHASYYPGSLALDGKLLYSPDGKILGAQFAGYDGVDKRIDVISSYMAKEGNVYDLADFEQAYAPPFNSAKDIINMLGFIAVNNLEKLSETITVEKAKAFLKEGAVLLDVRTKGEYELGFVKGAVNVSHFELRNKLDLLDKNKTIIVLCAVGLRGHIATRILKQHGFERVYNVTGGYKTWSKVENLEEEREATPINIVAEAECVSNVISYASLDCTSLQCPGPVIKLKEKMDSLKEGDVLSVSATDPGFYNDVKAWASATGNMLLSLKNEKGVIEAQLKKGVKSDSPKKLESATLIVFSNDFDKVLASFVLANGAAAIGKQVTMFFTFWGLSVLRKKSRKKVRKDFMGRMFSFMLPKGMADLSLSSMNFMGAGVKMMKGRMKKKQVEQLESMYESAKRAGVRFIACQMSMDIMGIKKEELVDGVEIGGVGTYMERADKSNINLFM